jgi:hypothetical protein
LPGGSGSGRRLSLARLLYGSAIGFLIREVYALISLGSLADHLSAFTLCLFIVYFTGKYIDDEKEEGSEDEDNLRLF